MQILFAFLQKLLFSIIVFAASSHTVSACQIAYGSNWAIGFSAPKEWASACGVEKDVGAPVAFWPEKLNFASAPAVMYINVSSKEPPTLEAFVRFSQNQFRSQAPSVVFNPLKLPTSPKGAKAIYFSANGDPGGNSEHIAYIEGPSSFFIVVLSARNPSALAEAKPAFVELLSTLSPMAVSVRKE